jgi:Arc/MetJ-type ribon-helix-helix transcriptional regulator
VFQNGSANAQLQPRRLTSSSAADGCKPMLDRSWYDDTSYLEKLVPKTKVAVTVDSALLERVDALVVARRFANRSQAVEAALAETVARAARTRLASECAKVNPREEQALAEEGFAGSRDTWPEY